MPDGTTPTSAVRQQAAGPQSRGLRIGGITIPWWAVGVGAVGVGLVGFLIYRNMKAGQASQTSTSGVAQSPMSPGVSAAGTPTAATLVPLPYPTSGTTSGATATQASGLGAATPVWSYTVPSSGNYVWQATGVNTPQGFPTGQAFPGPIPQGLPGFGAYSAETAPVPAGFTPTTYAQLINTQGQSNPSASSLASSQLFPTAA